MFKKMLQALGVGGPSVDTVLAAAHCRPGEPLVGEVRLVGGEADAEIEHITLSLVTRVERGTARDAVEFHRVAVTGRTRLAAKEQRTIPFQLPMPWHAPLTDVFGQHLHGMNLGLRTELAIAKAVDKGDLDPVAIAPLPAQERVLEAFAQLGFHFKSADLEAGHLHGTRQELPFFQEFEFYPPAAYAGGISEVELSFLPDPSGIEVILQADRRGGMPGVAGRVRLSHEEALSADWAEHITGWLTEVVEQRQRFAPQPGYGHPGAYGQPGMHGGHYGDERRGPGMGGMIAAGAAGVVGGMIAGELLEDAFGGGEEDFGGDEG